MYVRYVCVRSIMSNSGDLMDCSPPGSSVHGIFQARILEWEWVAISFSKGFPDPGMELIFSEAPTLAGGFFTTSTT